MIYTDAKKLKAGDTIWVAVYYILKFCLLEQLSGGKTPRIDHDMQGEILQWARTNSWQGLEGRPWDKENEEWIEIPCIVRQVNVFSPMKDVWLYFNIHPVVHPEAAKVEIGPNYHTDITNIKGPSQIRYGGYEWDGEKFVKPLPA